MSYFKKSKTRKLISSFFLLIMINIVNALRILFELTYRIEHINEHNRNEAKSFNSSGAYLLACWHEIVFLVSIAQYGHPFCALCSRSPSGRAVGFLMRRMGFSAIFGSQSSGGKEARDEILSHLKKGLPGAITIDGSSGPRRFVKPGIVDLAVKGRVAILPVFAHADRSWVLNTWDKFRIPKMFAKIYVVYGTPIEVPQGTEWDYSVVQTQLKTSLEEMETNLLAELNMRNDAVVQSKKTI